MDDAILRTRGGTHVAHPPDGGRHHRDHQNHQHRHHHHHHRAGRFDDDGEVKPSGSESENSSTRPRTTFTQWTTEEDQEFSRSKYSVTLDDDSGGGAKKEVTPLVLPQIAASSFVAVNAFRVGFVTGFNSVGIPSFQADVNRPFNLTIHDRSVFASSANLASLFGALLSGTVARVFGRKWPLVLLPIPMSLAWLLVAYPLNSAMMISCRLIQGFLNGIYVGLGQVYISEVGHKSMRGFLLSTHMMWLSFGQLLCFIIGAFVYWRTLALIAMAFPLIFIPILGTLPLSPVWLVKHGREADALKSLIWLRGKDYDCKGELEDIKKHLREARERQESLKGIMKFAYLKPCILGAVLIILRTATGYFAVVLFTLKIFQAAGSSIHPNIATIIVGAVVFIFTCIAAFSVDKLGRKRLILTATVVMTVAHVALGTYFFVQNSVTGLGWLPLVCMMTIVAAFSLGLGNLQYIIMGELLPVQVKNQATRILFATSSLAQFLVVLAFEYMRIGMGDYGVFWFYAVCCALLGVICAAAMPETKGRSLREIEQHMTSSKASRSKRTVSADTTYDDEMLSTLEPPSSASSTWMFNSYAI